MEEGGTFRAVQKMALIISSTTKMTQRLEEVEASAKVIKEGALTKVEIAEVVKEQAKTLIGDTKSAAPSTPSMASGHTGSTAGWTPILSKGSPMEMTPPLRAKKNEEGSSPIQFKTMEIVPPAVTQLRMA